MTISKKNLPKLPPLRDVVILYVDNRPESRQAQELLRIAGITPFVTDGPVEPLERKPLLLYNGGRYQGSQSIYEWLKLLEHWSKVLPNCDAFAKV